MKRNRSELWVLTSLLSLLPSDHVYSHVEQTGSKEGVRPDPRTKASPTQASKRGVWPVLNLNTGLQSPCG